MTFTEQDALRVLHEAAPTHTNDYGALRITTYELTRALNLVIAEALIKFREYNIDNGD